jgi:hypothetical protein
MRFQLLAQTMKWGAILGVLVAAMSWHIGANYQLLLDLAVSVGTILVVKQAVRARQYIWASGFVGMALLLNPMVPVFTPAGNLMLLLFLVGLSPLVMIFAALMDATVTLYPNLITDLNPRGESLRPPSEWTGI